MSQERRLPNLFSIKRGLFLGGDLGHFGMTWSLRSACLSGPDFSSSVSEPPCLDSDGYLPLDMVQTGRSFHTKPNKVLQ